jgi:hypothetical protein
MGVWSGSGASRRPGRRQRVYHITCVDAVSQWQVHACVQGFSEACLLPVPVLEMEMEMEMEIVIVIVVVVVIAQFPFQV